LHAPVSGCASRCVCSRCLSRTQIPDIDRNAHCCYILNTEPRGLPGGRWLAFFFNHHANTLEYFDSYGMALGTYANAHKSLHGHGLTSLHIQANIYGSLQSDISLVCGHYCMAYLCWRSNNTRAPTIQFSISLARRYRIAIQPDKYVVEVARDLRRPGNCCVHMLERSDCSQACSCAAKQR
jgi:hypothetical protein